MPYNGSYKRPYNFTITFVLHPIRKVINQKGYRTMTFELFEKKNHWHQQANGRKC